MKTSNDYPAMRVLKSRGREVAVLSGAGVLLIGVLLGVKGVRGIMGAALMGAAASLLAKNLAELNEVIAETLLPQ